MLKLILVPAAWADRGTGGSDPAEGHAPRPARKKLSETKQIQFISREAPAPEPPTPQSSPRKDPGGCFFALGEAR